MEQKTFKVPNVGCNGCVNTIKGELQGWGALKRTGTVKEMAIPEMK